MADTNQVKNQRGAKFFSPTLVKILITIAFILLFLPFLTTDRCSSNLLTKCQITYLLFDTTLWYRFSPLEGDIAISYLLSCTLLFLIKKGSKDI